jgi:hypothetical protein
MRPVRQLTERWMQGAPATVLCVVGSLAVGYTCVKLTLLLAFVVSHVGKAAMET